MVRHGALFSQTPIGERVQAVVLGDAGGCDGQLHPRSDLIRVLRRQPQLATELDLVVRDAPMHFGAKCCRRRDV